MGTYSGESVLLDEGTVEMVEGASTALGVFIGSGGWQTDAGISGAQALSGTRLIGVASQPVGTAGLGVGGAEM